MEQPFYKALASAIVARNNCLDSWGNSEDEANLRHWEAMTYEWDDRIEELICHLPQGSGFDSEPSIDLENASDERILIEGSYHAMDDGSYLCWVDFGVLIRPSLTMGIIVDVETNIGDILSGCSTEPEYDNPWDLDGEKISERDYVESVIGELGDYIAETYAYTLEQVENW